MTPKMGKGNHAGEVPALMVKDFWLLFGWSLFVRCHGNRKNRKPVRMQREISGASTIFLMGTISMKGVACDLLFGSNSSLD